MRYTTSFIWIVLSFITGYGQSKGTNEIHFPISCEGQYQGHLQGITTDGKALFWSFTDTLVKTDMTGRLLHKVAVDDHHGDLWYNDGKVYVATNLGQFNQPAGKADSWIYIYDAQNLHLLEKHPVPEVVHGSGGIAGKDGQFYVVGGLPESIDENYVYVYDANFEFSKRVILPSKHTHLGIQAVDFINGSWYFGCYGDPRILIKTDDEFNITGQWNFDAALGITSLPDGRILVARGFKNQGFNGGKIYRAAKDPSSGLRIEISK